MSPALDDAGLSARLSVALAAAAAAGARLLERFEGVLHVQTKSTEIDLVTEADREAEAIVLAHLRAAFPRDGIVAEESGAVVEAQGPCWYVDPLDGTTNYAHHLPHFSVSIALHSSELDPTSERASPPAGGLLGVVHDPCRAETFFAVRGRGAWLRSPRHGERSLSVTDVDRLGRAVVSTGFGYDRRAGGNLAEFARVMPRVQGIRRLGSAALDLAYVAAGRLDGYWEHALQPWDWAAGVVLVHEAGGVVRTMHDEPWSLRGPSVCVAGPRLFGVLQATLVEVEDDRRRTAEEGPASP